MATVTISRKGFAQVEPNHLSGIVTGQIYAQLPADSTLGDIIENGRFVKYDYAAGKVNLTGAGEWMLVYNEERHPDPKFPSHKDYAMIKGDYVDGVMVPRVIKTNVGDIYTTNAFGMSTGKNSDLSASAPDVAGLDVDDAALETTTFQVDKTTGYLVFTGNANADTAGPTFGVAKVYTLADGQPAVKLFRIK